MNSIKKASQPASNIEWKQWAKNDPLFGVATLPGREATGSNPWTYEDFYRHGELIWSDYYPAWESYGVVTESCLEIGCGAGRITRQLARHFRQVSAIDISPAMIKLAKIGAPSADFKISDGRSLPHRDNVFTAVFSCEVFQHFDSREMAATYFREIFRVMRSGGTMMIHIPIAILPFRRVVPTLAAFQRFLWRISDWWQQLKANVKRWLIVHRNRKPFYRLLQYDPDWLYAHLTEIGFEDVQILIIPVTGNPGQKVLASHLYAKKPMHETYVHVGIPPDTQSSEEARHTYSS